MFCVSIGQGADGIFTQVYTVISSRVERETQLGGEGDAPGWRWRRSWVEMETQLGGEGDAAGWKGKRSWVEGEMQLGGEGDAAGWRGRCSRVEREKGSGRTVGRPGASIRTARGV